MKVTLDRLSKKGVEKDAQIGYRNKQIVDLTKNFEKRSSETLLSVTIS